MKKLILAISIFTISAGYLYSQSGIDNSCGTMEYLKKQIENDPQVGKKLDQYEEQVRLKLLQQSNSSKREIKDSIIYIPVVVHILYKRSEENVPDSVVFEQINMLNRDFSGLNANSMGAFSNSLKSNTKIRFCLAAKMPNGTPTNGIERRETTRDSFTPNNDVKRYLNGGLDAWDVNKYFNIWVCNLKGAKGYGVFPGTGITAMYGAVIYYLGFGKTTAHKTHNNGSITAHEVGHCFNLRHIWGDDQGTCTGTDFCDDTPDQGGPTPTKYISGIITDNCTVSGNGIMYMNFMDYTGDSTMANFTPDQTKRMQVNFAGSDAVLWKLANSDACNINACETPINLTGTFSSNKLNVSWLSMYGSTKYNFRYRVAGTQNWTTLSSNTNSISISNLIKNTNYEYQVQNVCKSGNSIFSASNFTVTKSSTKRDDLSVDANPIISNQIKIYPNPANEKLFIEIHSESSQKTEIQLIDYTGKIIRTETIELTKGEHTLTLDITDLKPGVYIIKILKDDIIIPNTKIIIE
ncbi:MAG: M43 family zinc metalloprotease [Bacteroidota bacterium]|nr:M43 family zinc metalloprotease [Bacteroidota bacterium]